ncbi:MAG: polysaccharide deacetylase family protein [Steroidobacteraceae bacterium]|jgi:peptidoglycan/xylan/chitin deacetylase (PgdA/CDA1 family)|nr:polysaccharide deacetylase family protein [Steroidobacteraceae bacterium]
MSLPPSYLEYPRRRHGMDHDLYPWSKAFARPKIEWPDGARVALWIVPALEFFPLNPTGKPFKAPGSMVTPYPDLRHFTTRDYGNRVAIYRIAKLLDRFGLRASVAVNGAVAERYPALVRDLAARDWEVLAHGWDMDTLHHGGLAKDAEAAVIAKTLGVLRKVSGQAVTGWLSPAKCESGNTLELVQAHGVEYVCDWVNDDLPYEIAAAPVPGAVPAAAGGYGSTAAPGRPTGPTLVAMPHSTELSDRQILIDYHHTEDEYAQQLCDQFDVLYAEAARYGGRVLCIPLTPYITGLPYRIQALRGVLEHVTRRAGVWNATGTEIARAWRAGAAPRG